MLIRTLREYSSYDEDTSQSLMPNVYVYFASGLVLQANLARLKLPYPEAVFDISFFRKNPIPFYNLAHELYPGKFRPTLSHSFVRLLDEKKILLKCFTQNIDTLERLAGVPDEKIIEAHGSFATQRCIDCKTEYSDELMKKHVEEKKIARCDRCKGLIKPDIVFFGESLPKAFMESIPLLEEADLLIIMGTSLTVHPFAALAGLVPRDTCPRVLINLDKVGDLGHRPDDVLLLGRCDQMVIDLCKELGWEDRLRQLWAETELGAESGHEDTGEAVENEEQKEKEEEEQVQAEVDALTAAVEESLKISPSDVEETGGEPAAETSKESIKASRTRSKREKL
ncbi:hypothetical protein NMY22_g18342 [Coprinellus aureogranulatus]|nr:hypothetical protein NMY22_g18342 [Coprinellus aureogranulatus]